MAPFFIGKTIAINCWKEIPNAKDYVHFYTHINNNFTHVPSEVTAKFKPIYTSSFLAWYLCTYMGAARDAFITVEPGVQHSVYKNGKEITFEFVTTNFLQPSFMILFKSEGSEELFAGNCKFSAGVLSIRSLLPYLSTKRLNKIYFDGTYMNCPQIPPVDQILRTIITTIKTHRKKIIYISTHVIGNESILSRIAQAVNLKIHVSPEKFAVVTKLGLDKYFTTNASTTHIRTIDYSQISVKKVLKRNAELGPSITLVLSLSAYTANQNRKEVFQKNGIIFFPLTSLNTPSELQIMKQIHTNEYVLTNLILPVPNGSSGDNDESTDNRNSNLCKNLRLKKYSKLMNYDDKVVKELKKCDPQYWMSWTEYLTWRRQKCTSQTM